MYYFSKCVLSEKETIATLASCERRVKVADTFKPKRLRNHMVALMSMITISYSDDNEFPPYLSSIIHKMVKDVERLKPTLSCTSSYLLNSLFKEFMSKINKALHKRVNNRTLPKEDAHIASSAVKVLCLKLLADALISMKVKEIHFSISQWKFL